MILLVADVELVPHPLGVVLDFGEQLVFAKVAVEVEVPIAVAIAVAIEIAIAIAVELGINVVPGLPLLGALLVDLEVDLHIQVHIHLEILLLGHHLAHLLQLELFGRGVQLGMG